MSQLVTVMEGLAELLSGKVIEVGSQRWFDWLDFDECRSFRFADGETPYTCRKEKVKGIDGYWYGYRKVEGKLHKRYIGASEALSMSRLIEVGEMLQVATAAKLPKALGNSMVETQELPNALGNLAAINNELHNEVTQLKEQLAQVRSQLPQPDAATLLNQLKARRKKSKADLVDIEMVLEMLEPKG